VEKIRIRDKHPGSATLHPSQDNCCDVAAAEREVCNLSARVSHVSLGPDIVLTTIVLLELDIVNKFITVFTLLRLCCSFLFVNSLRVA
jgi:hypothetical protein